MNNSPIGMFDSGVGGFTLAREAFNILPNEEIIYFGDTARSPYGVKTDEEILNCSREIVDFLIAKGAKLIVIACNTATIASIEELKKEYSIPIIGVVEPGIEAALMNKQAKKIGLIGTDFTVNSRKYEEIIIRKNENLQVIGKGCPYLVTLAEEGVFNNEHSHMSVKNCLSSLLDENIDTLILACTHFPLHMEDIKAIVPSTVNIVDPALKTIEATKNLLIEKNMLREKVDKPEHKFICSGDIESFKKVYNVVFKEEYSIEETPW